MLHLDVDKALVIANTLKSSDIATPDWVEKYPLWFMALRDDDICEIHDKIWINVEGKKFARYAAKLAQLETVVASIFSEQNFIKLIISSEMMREKFYRYVVAVLFTAGLRTVDSSTHDFYVWNSKYYTGVRFKLLFETHIDSNELSKLVRTHATEFFSDIDYTNMSRIACLTQAQVKTLINDAVIASGRASNPMRFVYGNGWSTLDRKNNFFYGRR